MLLLLDSSLWIDFTHSRSPVELKQFIAPWVLDPQACLAEPVRFELLRSARPNELIQLDVQSQQVGQLTRRCEAATG